MKSGAMMAVMVVAVLAASGAMWSPACASTERPYSNTAAPDQPFSDEELPVGPPENPIITARNVRPLYVMAASAIIIALIACAVALYAARAVRQPRNVTVNFLNESERGEVSEFMRKTAENLQILGFGQFMDFTVPELPHQGVFRILFTGDHAHSALIYEICSTQSRLNKIWLSFVEFQTTLDNGYKINTSNGPMKHSLKPVPGLIVRRHPRLTDIRELFEAHRAEVEETRASTGGRIDPQRPEEFKERFEEEWREVNEYQEAAGIMNPTSDPDALRGSMRLVFRTLAPENESGGLDREALGTAALGAAVMLMATVSMPTFTQHLGLDRLPYFADFFEAVIVACVSGAVGYSAGGGGAMLGFLCYLPVAIVFESGPIGHLVPAIIALNAGTVGDKIRNRPAADALPLYKHLSPEFYITVLFVLVAGVQL